VLESHYKPKTGYHLRKACYIVINSLPGGGGKMTEEQINRINELARKKKTVGLTESESIEQKKLYRLFIDEIKNQIKQQLDSRRNEHQ
jgi:hypothetical protein